MMNEVLRPYLRKFALVFFDDLLIYSVTWEHHLKLLGIILKVLPIGVEPREVSLWAKGSGVFWGM